MSKVSSDQTDRVVHLDELLRDGELDTQSVLAHSTVQIPRRHGGNVSTLLSKLFGGPTAAISEMIANGHDADASVVEVTVHFDPHHPEKSFIEYKDDGSGMDLRGLAGHVRVGDSNKKNVERTAGGRKPFGNFGVGAAAIRSLGARSHLETTRGGITYSLEEVFSEDDNDHEQEILARPRPAREEEVGTRIRISDLRIEEGRGGLSIRDLRRTVGRSMGGVEGFTIIINGEPVRGIEHPKNAISYVVNTTVDQVGPVQGELVVYPGRPAPRDVRGIYLMVQGRGIGPILQDRIKQGLLARVSGTVTAEGLKDEILLSRGGLTESRNVEAVYRVIQRALRDAKNDLELQQRTGSSRVTRGLDQIITELGTELQGQLRTERPVKIDFDSTKSGAVARLDRQASDGPVIYINPGAESLALLGTKASDLKVSIGRAVEYALARDLLDPASREQFEAAHRRISATIYNRAKRHPLSLVIDAQARVSNQQLRASRLYTLRELAPLTGRTNKVLKEMLEQGVLTRFRDREHILGDEVIKMRKKMAGYRAVAEVIGMIWPESGQFTQRHDNEVKVKKQLAGDAKCGNLPSCVVDLDGTGFYVVKMGEEAAFQQYMNPVKPRGRKERQAKSSSSGYAPKAAIQLGTQSPDTKTDVPLLGDSQEEEEEREPAATAPSYDSQQTQYTNASSNEQTTPTASPLEATLQEGHEEQTGLAAQVADGASITEDRNSPFYLPSPTQKVQSGGYVDPLQSRGIRSTPSRMERFRSRLETPQGRRAFSDRGGREILSEPDPTSARAYQDPHKKAGGGAILPTRPGRLQRSPSRKPWKKK